MDAIDLTQAVTINVRNPVEAHRTVTDLYQKVLKPMTLYGREMRITVGPVEDERSVQQNRFYWGVVLKEISAQAQINGQRYSAEAFHELGKRQFLGYEIKQVAVAGRKRKTVIRRLRSTTRLSVRAMNTYLDKLMAFAVNDLGVEFSQPWWSDRP